MVSAFLISVLSQFADSFFREKKDQSDVRSRLPT